VKYTYEVGEEGLTNPSRLRLINEVQHRVISFLMALIKNEEKRYPDEVLVRIILEHPEDLELQRQLQEAFDHLVNYRQLKQAAWNEATNARVD
jgi:hypothetical protein